MKSTMLIAHGNDTRKSWNCPTIVKRNGKKVTDIQSVAVKIDFRKCTVESIDACQRGLPSAIISMYESMITMESSTIIPSVTISAARVTVFSSMPSM